MRMAVSGTAEEWEAGGGQGKPEKRLRAAVSVLLASLGHMERIVWSHMSSTLTLTIADGLKK